RPPTTPKPRPIPSGVKAHSHTTTVAVDASEATRGLDEYDGGLRDESDIDECATLPYSTPITWRDDQADSDDPTLTIVQVDNLTRVEHVAVDTAASIPERPRGVPNGSNGRVRWTTNDLDASMRRQFQHELIPLTRVHLSTLPPWHTLTLGERQDLFMRVFPRSAHVVQENDTNSRVTEWHGKFASAALVVLNNHFIKERMLEPEQRIRYVEEQLGTSVAAMKAPFMWRKWRNDGKKQGSFGSHLILKTFGVVHIPVVESVPLELRDLNGSEDIRPCGALILATLAVERALRVWSTGHKVIAMGQPGYFSSDNWNDRPVIVSSKGTVKAVTKVAELFKRAQNLEETRWCELIDDARKFFHEHKSTQEKQAIVVESASDVEMTESDIMSDPD
ncbi:hypothetical protein C8Q73DRAFT_658547, partial [Cubamyces lactineus]